jgi:Putative zinc-finger of transcription factor IIIC complex
MFSANGTSGVPTIASEREQDSQSDNWMSDEENLHEFLPWRLGTTDLSSCPSKPNNIDISPSGAVLIRCDEAVDIVNIRHGGIAPFLESDDQFLHHRDAGKHTETFHSSIFIGDVPIVGINGRVGKDRKIDLTTYEKRFMHAQWAPLEIGPNASPFFATLTTRRDLHLWYAPDNQFIGPWQCLTCLSDPRCAIGDGLDISVSAFTFLDPSPDSINEQSVHLMATCQDENRAIVWQIQLDHYGEVPLSIIMVYDGVPEGYSLKETYLINSIYPASLQSEGEELRQMIAVVGPEGLQILRFNAEICQLESQLWANEREEGSYSTIFANTYVYHAQWSKRNLCLYLCTAGQLFEVNFHQVEEAQDIPTYARLIIATLDSKGEKIANLKPVIGLQLDQGTDHKMTITLKDGTIYRYNEKFPQNRQAVLPAGEIEAPNTEVQELQRDMEKKRGMYAFKSDDCGVAFLNLDNNDVSPWSFIQHPTSTLEVALTQAHFAGLNQNGLLTKAKAIMYEFVHLEEHDINGIPIQNIARRSKLKRSLSLHLERAIDTAPIFRHCALVIENCKEDGHLRLASALQLSYWLKSFKGKGLESGMFADVCKDIEQLKPRLAFDILQNHMKYILDLLKEAGGKGFDDFSEMHCMRIAAIAFCLANRLDEDLGTIESLLADLRGMNIGAKLIHEWTVKVGANPATGIDVGERCPICDTPVLVGIFSPFEASCRDGHKWNRCSTTFGILCNIRASACIVCCHQSILVEDATSDLQKSALEACTRCAICGGTKVII